MAAASSVTPSTFKEYEGCTACFGMDGSAADNPLVQCEGCLGWAHALCGRVPASVLADERAQWFCAGCASHRGQLPIGQSKCAVCPVTLPAVMTCDAKSGVLVHQACVMHHPVFEYNFTAGAFKPLQDIGVDRQPQEPRPCTYCRSSAGVLAHCSVSHHRQTSARAAFHPLCRLYGAEHTRPPMWIRPDVSLAQGRRADENVLEGIDFRQKTTTLRVCLCDLHTSSSVSVSAAMVANLESVEVQKERKRLLEQLAPQAKRPAEMLMMMQDVCTTTTTASTSQPAAAAVLREEDASAVRAAAEAAAAAAATTAAEHAAKAVESETRVAELTRQVQRLQQERAQQEAAAEQERTRFLHHIAQLEARHTNSTTAIQQMQATNQQFADAHQQNQHTIAQLVMQVQAYEQFFRSQPQTAVPIR